MTDRSVTHATFVIERDYDASPRRVFAAWATPEAKSQWFGTSGSYRMDFREGGTEELAGGPPGGPVYTYVATYTDIVPDTRIVSTYQMHAGSERISVSVATVEFQPSGTGTRLVYTEQGAFLDGLDRPEDRERGTGEMLDQLAKVLA